MKTKEALLKEIEERIPIELNCPLKKTATNLVFGKGNPNAKIMFIGEASGEKEDLEGKPFVGRAGKELDKLLHSIGLTLEECYVANILKYRPPKNRDPKPTEIKAHTPYLIEQIKIIKPKIIATLGNYSTKFVLAGFKPEGMEKIQGVGKLHGTQHKIKLETEEFIIVPIYHPAAMLYRPQLREETEKDFKVMRKIIDENL